MVGWLVLGGRLGWFEDNVGIESWGLVGWRKDEVSESWYLYTHCLWGPGRRLSQGISIRTAHIAKRTGGPPDRSGHCQNHGLCALFYPQKVRGCRARSGRFGNPPTWRWTEPCLRHEPSGSPPNWPDWPGGWPSPSLWLSIPLGWEWFTRAFTFSMANPGAITIPHTKTASSPAIASISICVSILRRQIQHKPA